MKIKCRFLSDNPIAYDVYKYPTLRYVCRNPERIKSREQFSARFVGNGPEDCDKCPLYESININNNETT